MSACLLTDSDDTQIFSALPGPGIVLMENAGWSPSPVLCYPRKMKGGPCGLPAMPYLHAPLLPVPPKLFQGALIVAKVLEIKSI